MKKWTQLDQQFCKNKGSKRFKNEEEGGQLYSMKIKKKIDTKCFNTVKWQILGQS